MNMIHKFIARFDRILNSITHDTQSIYNTLVIGEYIGPVSVVYWSGVSCVTSLRKQLSQVRMEASWPSAADMLIQQFIITWLADWTLLHICSSCNNCCNRSCDNAKTIPRSKGWGGGYCTLRV
jgi:hypothetical protein